MDMDKLAAVRGSWRLHPQGRPEISEERHCSSNQHSPWQQPPLASRRMERPPIFAGRPERTSAGRSKRNLLESRLQSIIHEAPETIAALVAQQVQEVREQMEKQLRDFTGSIRSELQAVIDKVAPSR
mmetsp:Transcript_10047/g.28828  ORF Transcript_10047/g.28828 Transcript_10047/m.28828 type:complete len:127 (-) Transcript_10047:316-696(-)